MPLISVQSCCRWMPRLPDSNELDLPKIVDYSWYLWRFICVRRAMNCSAVFALCSMLVEHIYVVSVRYISSEERLYGDDKRRKTPKKRGWNNDRHSYICICDGLHSLGSPHMRRNRRGERKREKKKNEEQKKQNIKIKQTTKTEGDSLRCLH